MSRVGRVTRAGRAVGGTTVDLVRNLVVADLRGGIIRLQGLDLATRIVVYVASALLLGVLAAFALGDVWRGAGELLVLPGGNPGRGTLVPEALVPFTFLLLAIGSALVLTGGLHAGVAIRLVVLVSYLLVAVSVQGVGRTAAEIGGADLRPGWVGIAGVVAVYAARWRSPARPALELAVLLGFVGLTFAVAQHALVDLDRLGGSSFAVSELNVLIGILLFLATPLVYAAGLDVIAFGATASGWVATLARDRLGRRITLVVLLALVAWRVKDVVVALGHRVDDDGVGEVLAGYAGALGVLVVVGAVWWAIGQLAQERPGVSGDERLTEAAGGSGIALGLAFGAVIVFLLTPAQLIVQSLVEFDVGGVGFLEWWRDVTDVFASDTVTTAMRFVIAASLLAFGLVVARRGRASLGLFVASIGAVDLYTQLTIDDRPLEVIQWRGEAPIDFWWMALLAGLTVVWLVRRTLTHERAVRLLFVALLTTLLTQSTAIADPITPFLGFAGVGVVAVGVLWSFVTAGSFANESSPRLPRTSRLFLYLGYALFSVTLLNWLSGIHDVDGLADFTGGTTDNGRFVLGFPLLFALFTVTLAGAAAGRAFTTEDETEAVAEDFVEDLEDHPD